MNTQIVKTQAEFDLASSQAAEEIEIQGNGYFVNRTYCGRIMIKSGSPSITNLGKSSPKIHNQGSSWAWIVNRDLSTTRICNYDSSSPSIFNCPTSSPRITDYGLNNAKVSQI